MKLGDSFHLTYCSNIHAGESWAEVRGALSRTLPCVREALGHGGPFAIGLRLSAAAATTLEQRAELEEFREFLHSGDYYVPTINGFPYGAFHGTRVKERVYLPDWRDPARVEYSNRLARVLAAVASDRRDTVSISTVPGAFREEVRTPADVEALAAGFLTHAAYLKRLRDETGVTITLAIEPEPACYIETVEEAIAFFRAYLFAPPTLARAATTSGVRLTADDVARHVGMCLDVCHMAVEFEDAKQAVRDVLAAGIRIAKVQLSSALRLQASADSSLPDRVFGPFAEDVYLHQVVVSTDEGFRRFTDLPQALAASRQDRVTPGEWRVHFHVPIFLETLQQFGTTQDSLRAMLEALERNQVSTCLEVETYTWDVLPPEYRTTDVCTAIARELSWVRDRLSR
jgi:sugar phosphate isomerase/epimerase